MLSESRYGQATLNELEKRCIHNITSNLWYCTLSVLSFPLVPLPILFPPLLQSIQYNTACKPCTTVLTSKHRTMLLTTVMLWAWHRQVDLSPSVPARHRPELRRGLGEPVPAQDARTAVVRAQGHHVHQPRGPAGSQTRPGHGAGRRRSPGPRRRRGRGRMGRRGQRCAGARQSSGRPARRQRRRRRRRDAGARVASTPAAVPRRHRRHGRRHHQTARQRHRPYTGTYRPTPLGTVRVRHSRGDM